MRHKFVLGIGLFLIVVFACTIMALGPRDTPEFEAEYEPPDREMIGMGIVMLLVALFVATAVGGIVWSSIAGG